MRTQNASPRNLVFLAVLLATWIAGGFVPQAHAEEARSQSAYPENPLDGSRIFFEKGCPRCHSIYGVGGVVGPDLAKVELMPSLLGIAALMWNHAPRMMEEFSELGITPGKFETAEMASLMSFLYYLSYLEKQADPERGEELFSRNHCIRCHTVGGRGGVVGPPLDRFAVYRSPIFITTAFWNAAPKMAKTMKDLGVERPNFSGHDLMDLLAYLRQEGTLQAEHQGRIYAPPGSPARGEALFQEKRCIQCHSVRGVGGTVGPDLGKPEVRGSFTHVASTIWNHGPNMWKKMEELQIPIPKFNDTEMSDLITYLYFVPYIDDPGDPVQGRMVFATEGCAACHPVGGKGGQPELAPDLMTQARKRGFAEPIQIITQMWNHIDVMRQIALEAGVFWPILDSRQIADLSAYLISLSEPERPPDKSGE